jgi:hypothetical protein
MGAGTIKQLPSGRWRLRPPRWMSDLVMQSRVVLPGVRTIGF